MIDCKKKTLEREGLVYKGSYSNPTVLLISAAKACKLVGKGCTTYLYAVEVVETPKLVLKDIPIVQEFPKLFQEVASLPPDQEIEFFIELVPGTAPISKAPCGMAPGELVELKKKLQELLDKGLIQPSVSPWGAPVLLVRKRMGVYDCALTIEN